MAWSLKEAIFGFFGPGEKKQDGGKEHDPDGEGRGTFERFNRVLGSDFDDNTLPPIEHLVDNTVHYRTILEKFIQHAEDSVGNPVAISNDPEVRRKILRFWISLCKIKGTIKSYEVLFKMMGFDSVAITEFHDEYGFDSPETLDSPLRRFDSGCKPCSGYIIELTGGILLDVPLIGAIGNVIEFLEPINAKLLEITYNGIVIEPLISIFVDSEGNLILDNTLDPAMSAALGTAGEVLLIGPNEAEYSADPGNGEVLHN